LKELMLVARLWVGDHEVAASAWQHGATVSLPAHAVRHIQVLRMQPGDTVCVFTGDGGEWLAEVVQMGRRDASVKLLQHASIDRELPAPVTLAVGMPANDRMDALIEKATELGVYAVQPLMCARSVLRLEGDRAAKKVSHWQSVAIAACEQSGRTRVPVIQPVRALGQWLPGWQAHAGMHGGVLSFSPDRPAQGWIAACLGGSTASAQTGLLFLNGPEGGLTAEEEALACHHGMTPIGLGPRVLRADTAPLMALSLVAAQCER
jgi:16S rRNA (uracil1498-N3)-methyltransferase